MAEESLKITLTVENKAALEALKKTAAELGAVEVAGGKAGGAAGKMGKDFTGLSRVIQDLPYGFNAISNNLTQLLPAAGAAGLAFSGIVTALTFAQIGFGAWTRALDKIKGPLTMTDELNKNYVKTLAEEKIQLDNLFKVAEDNNQSLKVREQAVSKLRETTGPYLQDLTDDQIMTGLAKDAHNELTEALKKQSIAQAALALGAPIQQKILEYDIELINQKKQAVQDYINASKGGTESISTGPGGPSVRITAEQRQLGVINQFERDRAALLKKQAEEQAKLNQLQDIAAKNAGIDLKNAKSGSAPPAPKIDGNFENYMNNMKALLPILDRFNASDAFQTLFLGRAKPIPLAPQRNTGTQDLQNLQLQVTANNTLNNALAIRNSEQMEYEEQLRESKAAALTNTLMNSVNGLFTAMQNGASIGDAIGDMFKQVAIDIAKAAVQATIFQGILMAFGGGGGVSFGQGFLGGFKKLLGFSQGGTVSGPQSGYPVMLHGTEHIVRPDQMKSIIASAAQMGGGGASRVVVEGRIRGNDIFLSQQRTGTFRNLTT